MYMYRLPHIFSYKIIMWGSKGNGTSRGENGKDSVSSTNSQHLQGKLKLKNKV